MHGQEESIYKFRWLDGHVESGRGKNVADAFARLGYGPGAIKALDSYEETKKVKVHQNDRSGFPVVV